MYLPNSGSTIYKDIFSESTNLSQLLTQHYDNNVETENFDYRIEVVSINTDAFKSETLEIPGCKPLYKKNDIIIDR